MLLFDEVVNSGSELDGIDFSSPIGIAIIVVGILIVLVGIFSGCVSLFLTFKYIRFNNTKNSKGLTGKDAARELLDKNDLQKIKVSKNGSLLFGNSYSHYFKKIRLRRWTWKKDSVTSLAMAAEKTGLAVLDKEGDPDMKSRIVLTPICVFGPYAFIPLIVIGLLIDVIVFNTIGVCTLIFSLSGFAFFILSFILQIKGLKTELKAQKKAYELLRENDMATEDEIAMMQELFKLYNIEYVNDIIIAFLEIIYRVLVTIAKIAAKNKSGASD